MPVRPIRMSRRRRSGRGSVEGRFRIVNAAYSRIPRPAVDWRPLSAMSSPPKIRVTAAALLEQPASLSIAA